MFVWHPSIPFMNGPGPCSFMNGPGPCLFMNDPCVTFQTPGFGLLEKKTFKKRVIL